ncbi:MAG TPA: glycerophosphodiester phosphodiesterase [Acidimicrobiales bacterium]|nr:glycerophosphodiester phosphodiesterase [Acidimicrobiales bacterium]
MTPAPVNPWLGRRVISYAHQGGAWEAPSSTLFAIRRALDLGATGIELDVHATADGHLVVSHDGTVDRTTDGHGAICDLTLDQIRSLDNAYWFVPGADVTPGLDPDAYPYRGRAPEDREFGVATLEEVFGLLDEHPRVALNLDVKATAPTVEPYEALLAEALDRHDHRDRVIVASFLDVATEAFARHAPGVARSAGTIAVAAFWRALADGGEPSAQGHVALQVPASYGERVLVDERFVAAAHRLGLAVHVWTINEVTEMARLLELGVDGIISDLPTPLVTMLRGRGVDWRP